MTHTPLSLSHTHTHAHTSSPHYTHNHTCTHTHAHTRTQLHDTREPASVQVLCKAGGEPLLMRATNAGLSCLDIAAAKGHTAVAKVGDCMYTYQQTIHSHKHTRSRYLTLCPHHSLPFVCFIHICIRLCYFDICIYMYIYVYTYTYINIYIYILYIYIYIYMYIYNPLNPKP